MFVKRCSSIKLEISNNFSISGEGILLIFHRELMHTIHLKSKVLLRVLFTLNINMYISFVNWHQNRSAKSWFAFMYRSTLTRRQLSFFFSQKKKSDVSMLSSDLILRCSEKLLAHPVQLVNYLWTELKIIGKIHPKSFTGGPGAF